MRPFLKKFKIAKPGVIRGRKTLSPQIEKCFSVFSKADCRVANGKYVIEYPKPRQNLVFLF